MRKGLARLIGSSFGRSGFFLRVSFVHRGTGVAAGRLPAETLASMRRTAWALAISFARGYSFELETRLHHPHRFLNHDHHVFDCRVMAFSEETNLKPLVARILFLWGDTSLSPSAIVWRVKIT